MPSRSAVVWEYGYPYKTDVLHSIPTAGNDLALIGLLAAVGLALGIALGFATHIRAGANALPVARVGSPPCC